MLLFHGSDNVGSTMRNEHTCPSVILLSPFLAVLEHASDLTKVSSGPRSKITLVAAERFIERDGDGHHVLKRITQ
jgi:hypothetical protein